VSRMRTCARFWIVTARWAAAHCTQDVSLLLQPSSLSLPSVSPLRRWLPYLFSDLLAIDSNVLFRAMRLAVAPCKEAKAPRL